VRAKSAAIFLIPKGRFAGQEVAMFQNTVAVWEGVVHNGVVLNELLYVDGDVFLGKEHFPYGTVIVAKRGTRLHEISGVEGELDLGWVNLVGAGPSCSGLPKYVGTYLEGTLWLKDGKNDIIVVSEELWEERWDEVEKFLFSIGLAYYEDWVLDCQSASVLLGGDPEFEVYADGILLPAYFFPIFEGLNSSIGTDGNSAIAELRPAPTYRPEKYVENFTALAEKLAEQGILLSVKGDTYPLGGHIHVGSHNEYVVEVLRDKVEEFIFVLDDFVGRVLLPTSGVARGEYAVLGAYELKDYGWEYRTPPSSIYADPEMVRITYKLVKGLVETLLRKGKLSYRTLEDGRAKEEEYHRFLTKEETAYFLAFPQRWKKGEISPFVPVKSLAATVSR
jgi:hypothetical protein